jgi:hypothetical protein
MKLSNIILLTSLSIGIGGLVGANYVMKKEFDKIDKTFHASCDQWRKYQ